MSSRKEDSLYSLIFRKSRYHLFLKITLCFNERGCKQLINNNEQFIITRTLKYNLLEINKQITKHLQLLIYFSVNVYKKKNLIPLLPI